VDGRVLADGLLPAASVCMQSGPGALALWLERDGGFAAGPSGGLVPWLLPFGKDWLLVPSGNACWLSTLGLGLG
jgi:hypothetical protein